MFRQSVLNAMGEVSDAMASNEQLKTQELTAVDQVSTLKEGIKCTNALQKRNGELSGSDYRTGKFTSG